MRKVKRVAMIGLVLLASVGGAAGYTPKAIPTGRDAYTWKKFAAEKAKWREKVLLNNYYLYGVKNEKWDEKARGFLTEMVRFFGGDFNEQLITKLKAESLELVRLGCTDAYIIYCYGNLLHHFESPERAEPYVRKAREAMEKSSYPPIYRYWVTNRLALICENRASGKAEAEELTDRKLKYFAQATADMMFKNGNERFIMEDFEDMWGRLRFDGKEKLFNYLKKETVADPWIAGIIRGCYYDASGWEKRGSGFANTVTEKGWVGFYEEMEKARGEFTKAYALHPNYPEAAARMISVAMSVGGAESPREWFDRAVAAQMDYRPAHTSLLWNLRPRWHGSHKEMYDFGVECLNTGRFDTEVPRLFLTAVWDIGGEMEDWREAYRQPGVYENMKRFYEGVLNEPTRQDERNHFKSAWAVVAWAAERYDDARKLYDELGNNVDAATFPDFNTTAKEVRGEVRARTGPWKDQIRQADELIKEKKVSEGIAALEKVYQWSRVDALASGYVRDRVVALRTESEFQRGGWIDLIPEGDFGGWSKWAGEWVVESDGTLKGTSTREGMMLVSDAVFPGGFEISGEIEAPFNAGLLLGYTQEMGAPRWVSFRIHARDTKVFLQWKFHAMGPTKQVDTIKGERNKFQVQVWNSRVTAFVNGERVFNAEEIDEGWWSWRHGRVGFGGYYVRAGYVAKFRNVQIRALKAEPKGFFEGAKR